ncbi:hypothetical protein [Deinococcus sp. QL22]|uniref:hypothetical protein n=1 Tax=Deinococcus sp. QL22 TaxID=2939437 RepID=UPI00201819FD|nr:hypothetical protein [Deinococcus sp. QL22]UQN05409.1 hypothetical protein M1R55_11040 [Deinococcus sp. QL22]
MTMRQVDRVCRLLALTIYDVRQHPTPEGEAEVAHLRRRLIDLGVAVNVGRVSAVQAAPLWLALEQDILRCRAQVHSSRRVSSG